jgi:VIT1/CCC1 family predicted Fe2+/Mn2+ transporter
MMRNQHKENHRTEHISWLRAAVLGANDGIISTASLIMGVAAAQSPPGVILTAGVAGLVAGAMSMAAGEYVSVSSQADTEKADLLREGREIEEEEEYERKELANIYIERGLDPNLAKEVAKQLMDKDALGAHAREELGISSTLRAKPVQAALASAGAFSLGAAMPILVIIISSGYSLIPIVAGTSLVFLGVLGGLAAYVGGANVAVATIRVIFWGLLAMGFTAAIGSLF